MLTELKIKHAKTGYWLDGDGLYLQVSKSGAKSWIYRYQLNGRRREMGLGSLSDVPAKDARRRAAEARALVHGKIDPVEHRKQQTVAAFELVAQIRAGAVTFKQMALEYIEANRAGWKNAKHASQWENTLATYAYPVVGDMPVGAVDTAKVLEVLNPIWLIKTETAKRLRGRIEVILSYAKVKGFRHGENPAAWRGHLDNVLPQPGKIAPHKHHPALPYDQMRDFICKLRGSDGVSALCVEFVILTACRSGEALKATWDEIDEEKGVWIVPAGRMKASKEHRVPLSVAALAVLEKAKKLRQGIYIFPSVRSGKPMSDMSLSMLLRRLHPGITVHGFRSSFRDWAAEATHYPGEMAEMALAHSVGNKVEAAYRRGDMFEKRRGLMADWAAWCEPKKVGNVVPLMSKASGTRA
ncbi:MAG: integrase arm-type DNA-binding domain-containing protein [Sulfuriferula multivorans]|uniref:Integrase arm-type DNA-binding domain-containing protein n=1 Tax=Sulfuriferula multivorans TaxID=1559896 RepID=A0A7C9P9B5_9PROT|nr:integrase arm-type DNA-binding domain-containing protein [Sulfuriferula multivorans]